MNAAQIANILGAAGYNVLGVGRDTVLLEDPSCIIRSIADFTNFAWIVLGAMALLLLSGWAWSMIRGAKNDIVTNIRNLFLLFAGIAIIPTTMDFMLGRGILKCKEIQIPTSAFSRKGKIEHPEDFSDGYQKQEEPEAEQLQEGQSNYDRDIFENMKINASYTPENKEKAKEEVVRERKYINDTSRLALAGWRGAQDFIDGYISAEEFNKLNADIAGFRPISLSRTNPMPKYHNNASGLKFGKDVLGASDFRKGLITAEEFNTMNANTPGFSAISLSRTKGMFSSNNSVSKDFSAVKAYSDTNGDIVYTDANGLTVINKGSTGTMAWRNNNPGNIKWGDNAKSFGAIGRTATDKYGNTFAIFPDMETGYKAQRMLWKSGKWGNGEYIYYNGTIEEGLNKYSPAERRADGSWENPQGITPKRLRMVASRGGPSANRKVSSLTDKEFDILMSVIEETEGFETGVTNVIMPAKKPVAPKEVVI